MKRSTPSRRQLLRTAALGTASAVFSPFIRPSHSAGKLSLGLWHHWVAAVNETLIELCHQWAGPARVDVKIDFIATTTAHSAEAQARSGHDILAHPPWQVVRNRRLLEPVDELMAPLLAGNGAISPVLAYLARSDGVWHAVPATVASQLKPCCSRLDLYRRYCGIDLEQMFPPGQPQASADLWSWDLYLQTARQLFAAGHPVGLPVGNSSDAIDWTAALFSAFGSVLIDAAGTIAVDSDATRAALEFIRQLMASNLPEVYGWDDTDNNRWLISGIGSGIINPPTAWAAAKVHNRELAELCWTHDLPRGPAGRFVSHLPFFYGIWSFAPNKAAAKDFLSFISQRPQVERLLTASGGVDIPPFANFYDFPFWLTAGPPAGTLYRYPPRGDETLTIAGFPARPELAMQIYEQALHPMMVARLTQGKQSIDAVIDWAQQQLETLLCRHPAHDCA